MFAALAALCCWPALAVTPLSASAFEGWLVTTHSGNDVQWFSAAGEFKKELVTPGSGGLDEARGVTIGPDGDLYVASAQKKLSQILRYRPTGVFVGIFARGGTMNHPYAVVFGPDGNLYASGQNDDAVSRFNGKTGAFMDTFVPPGSGGLKTIRDLVFAPNGDLLVASRDTNSILRYSSTGQPLGAFVAEKSGGLKKPIQLAFGPDGDLYVGSSGNSAVLRYNGKTGKFIGVFVPTGDHGLASPSGLAFDPTNGDLLVASRLSNQVLRYDREGKFIGVFIDRKDLDTPEFIVPWGK
jgi:DNA-binding beta-propeller fold protein YncE